jgi:alpha-beta hydrolase superfamily lysophospholipase
MPRKKLDKKPPKRTQKLGVSVSKKRVGAPSSDPSLLRPEDVVDDVLIRISETGDSISDIVRDNPNYPKYSTLTNYISRDHELRKRYEHARDVGAPILVDKLLQLADSELNDCNNSTEVSHLKLKIETRKWAYSRLFPRVLGDKLDLLHKGDPDQPIIHRIERVIVDPASK